MSVPLTQSSRWFARPLTLVVVVVLAVVATGFLGFRYWQERQAVTVAHERSRQVLDTLDRLRTIIADVEAQRRGYLLTLDPSYLKAYGVSDESVRRDAQALQALVANDPLQNHRAGHLALTVAAKLREIDDIVKTARTSGLAALAMIRSLDEIRSQIDQMVDHERFLIVDQEKRAEALERRQAWLIATAVAIVAILAVVALALARLEATRRRKAIAENVALHGDLLARDKKIRRLVDANIVGIIIWDLEGHILEANDAFLQMLGYDREDLISGRLSRTELTPAEWRDRDARTVEELKRMGTVQPFEKEYFRKDGSRVPVLLGGTMFEQSPDQGVSFVLDLTERKRAEAEARDSERRYRETLMELAHANRLTTMGQLSASIAHEVNQPIAATVTNAQAALRWLRAQPPDLDEVRASLGRIVEDGKRAGDVIGGIRALIHKVPSRKDWFDLNDAIREMVVLTRSEVLKHGISLQTELAPGLPMVKGDRTQLQQVILNLILNAIEAMGDIDEGRRELRISTEPEAAGGILVTVRDSGPGLDPADVEQVFRAFYTTKPKGMGMGLAICRSMVEAHGGRMWAIANEPGGAVFQFTLPLQRDESISARHVRPNPAA